MTQTVRTVVTNYSKFDKDIVWENAKDLEHVGVLHRNTNAYFELLYSEKFLGQEQYDVMVYRTKRKLIFFTFHSFGFRRIVSKYNLHQVEYIPLFRVTSALNSILKNSDKPGFKTLMVDEVVMTLPWWLAPFKKYLCKSLKRHTAIQCSEDEPLRERLADLRQRGIQMPYKKFHLSTFEHLTAQFQEKV